MVSFEDCLFDKGEDGESPKSISRVFGFICWLLPNRLKSRASFLSFVVEFDDFLFTKGLKTSVFDF